MIADQRSSEADLWKRRDSDALAREELVRRYMPLTRRLAGKYKTRWESFDDLLQVASLGLVNAIDRFDPARGSSFVSFAAPTIQGELKRYFRDRVWLVRVPRGLQEDIASVESATNELGAELHREPTAEEIDRYLNSEPGTAMRVAATKHARIPVSLDVRPTEDGVVDESEWVGTEDPGFRALEDTDEVRKAMETLDLDARLVMRLRFIDDLTQNEIAERIGCSQMHISRVLRRTVSSLRETISSASNAAPAAP